jgi:hypothetical protein
MSSRNQQQLRVTGIPGSRTADDTALRMDWCWLVGLGVGGGLVGWVLQWVLGQNKKRNSTLSMHATKGHHKAQHLLSGQPGEHASIQ